MHNFRMLTKVVRAARIGPDGHVEIDGRELVGDAGTWVVMVEGIRMTWTDSQFRERFEPADDDAREYLARVSP